MEAGEWKELKGEKSNLEEALTLKWSQFKNSGVLNAFEHGHFGSCSDSVSINFPSDQRDTRVC